MSHEKNMSFLVIAKSPKVWKQTWKDRTGLLYRKLQAIGLLLQYLLCEYLGIASATKPGGILWKIVYVDVPARLWKFDFRYT